MIVEIDFKDHLVASEFGNPNITDPRLFGMVCALGNWTWTRFKKRIVVTDVARYDGRPDSPHLIGPGNPLSRAADIRTHNGYWTPTELKGMLQWLRDNFPRPDMVQCEAKIPGWFGTARLHGAGDNEHLHLAVAPIEDINAAMGVPYV